MALSIDTSPVRQFAETLSQGATPAVWMWQVGVAILALALSSGVARIAFRSTQSSHRWKFGVGDFRRVAVPAFAYLILAIGRALLAPHQSVAVLDILAAVLVAALVLRVAVYILAHVLPEGALLRRFCEALPPGLVASCRDGFVPRGDPDLDEIGFNAGKAHSADRRAGRGGDHALTIALGPRATEDA